MTPIINLANSPASDSPETTNTPVRWTPEQKLQISELISERVGSLRKAHAKEISDLKATLAQPLDEAAANEIKSLKSTNYLLNKQIRLSDAIAKIGFKDNVAVRRLVQDDVEFDQERGTWLAKTEDGKVYHSLNVFLRDWSDANPFLAGPPSNASSSPGRPTLTRNGMTDSEKVAFIRKHGQLRYSALPKE